MADIEITVESGTQKRLLTAGKYCERNVLVTATGSVDPEPSDSTFFVVRTLNDNDEVSIRFSLSEENGVTIDWGDGASDTVSSTGEVQLFHTYLLSGEYTIELLISETCTVSLGGESPNNTVLGTVFDNDRYVNNRVVKANIGKGVIELKTSAFRNCQSLTELRGLQYVAAIGQFAFQNCYALRHVDLPKDLVSLPAQTFYYCESLVEISVPDTVLEIGASCFFGCHSLRKTNTRGASFIGSSCFRECYSMVEAIVNDGVTSLDSYAFNRCWSLERIVLPSTVTNIGAGAFYFGYGLKEVVLKSATPPTLTDTTAFSGVPSTCIFKVPLGSIEAYKAATNWSKYADQFVEDTE